jgi:methylmalonyl-CoA mutase
VPPEEPLPDLALAREFPAADRERWRSLVTKVLGDRADATAGHPPESALVTRTRDGLAIAPLYTRDVARPVADPGVPPFVRGGSGSTRVDGWDIRALHDDPDPAVVRTAVLDDLSGGATSVWLRLGPGQVPVESLPHVLEDVLIDLAPVVLDAGERTADAVHLLEGVVSARGLDPAAVRPVLGLDPLGLAARTGAPADVAGVTRRAAELLGRLPGATTMVVDALVHHEAGATDAQELALSVATGVEYLRGLTAAGLPASRAVAQLEFRYAATCDQFLTLAKLRAARGLWARVAEVVGATDGRQRQHAVTSWPMMTARDPWNNMLRTTLAAFAAGAGGADGVTVLPFDSAVGRSDALARRIARNTSALLVEESHVARVADPAGGSWYVESLSKAVGTAAWDLFQEIEAAGGMAAALASGLVAERLATARSAHWTEVLAGSDVVGVTAFPRADEVPLPREPSPEEQRHGLPRIRWAEPAEQLWARVRVLTDAGGLPPVPVLRPADGTSGRAVSTVVAALAAIGLPTIEVDDLPAAAGRDRGDVAVVVSPEGGDAHRAESATRAPGLVLALPDTGRLALQTAVVERLEAGADA